MNAKIKIYTSSTVSVFQCIRCKTLSRSVASRLPYLPAAPASRRRRKLTLFRLLFIKDNKVSGRQQSCAHRDDERRRRASAKRQTSYDTDDEVVAVIAHFATI
ncbi:unnamed protein product [Acanthoscelides obtectus]|uniref:Uncharacterized protein n=1 Tax=Acanthoscelides obtectus TaxID=200917 RepID=A0A9P0QFR3_ACAOB|nr:unnamed protein product [Acanthoscelides obtectus]CAK1682812.1 hypothetical protein AOBTE_LOCUS33905 [Acanthoscelides obtectus]